ncbi:MAG TPA: cytochrome c [Alphaproteobacteria bacterium]|nr:cytochrome c [Alphaproteobacteria bacterium]
MLIKPNRTLSALILASLVGLGAAVTLSVLPAAAVPAGMEPKEGAAAEVDPNSALARGGDPERGKTVFQNVGHCVECHGWGGDGTGSNPRSPGAAANLRETQLDTDALLEVIACGIPGTPMPYHLSSAYKSYECYGGMKLEDFGEGEGPHKGKTFREKDVLNVVAFIQQHFQPLAGTKPDLAECEAFFKPGSRNCAGLK